MSIVTTMLKDLSQDYVDVTIALATNLYYAVTNVRNETNVLESSDLFHRLYKGAEVWLKSFENTPVEAEICFHFLRLLLLPLVHAKSPQPGVLLMKVSCVHLSTSIT